MHIRKTRVADFERSTNDDGEFTSPAHYYVVLPDGEENTEKGDWFETEKEAEQYIKDNA